MEFVYFYRSVTERSSGEFLSPASIPCVLPCQPAHTAGPPPTYSELRSLGSFPVSDRDFSVPTEPNDYYWPGGATQLCHLTPRNILPQKSYSQLSDAQNQIGKYKLPQAKIYSLTVCSFPRLTDWPSFWPAAHVTRRNISLQIFWQIAVAQFAETRQKIWSILHTWPKYLIQQNALFVHINGLGMQLLSTSGPHIPLPSYIVQ